MNESDPNKSDKNLSKLSRLEDRIYSKDNPILFRDNRSIIHKNTGGTSETWAPLEEEPRQEQPVTVSLGFFHTLSRKVFFAAVFISLLVLGFTLYSFYFSDKTINKNKIGFTIETPGFIDGGVVFPVDAYITNGNKAQMQNVDLIIEYPKGETLTDQESMVSKRVTIGTIDQGQTAHGTTDIVLFGREGNIRNIKAYIEYYAPNSSNVFKKDITKTLTLRSAPLVVSTESLKEVSSNGDVALTVRLRAERGIDLSNVVLKVEYPQGFSFIKSSVPSFDEKNNWRFDSIPKGTEQTVTIYGRLRGEDGDEKVFHIYSGLEDSLQKGLLGILYTENKVGITITKPFIGIKALVKGAPQTSTGEYVIEAAKRIEGTLSIINNTETTITNISVNASLLGEVVNRAKVIPVGGYFDSVNNKLIWNQTTNKALKTLLPGDTVELPFVLESYSLDSKQNGYFANPIISLTSEVTGQRLSDVAVPEVYNASNPLVLKVASEARITSSVLHQTSDFKPLGVYPPQVEQETGYIITLNAYNRTNALSKTKVEIPLPPYIEYRGNFLPQGEDVMYDKSSNTIIWNIGELKEDTGYGREKRYISFEVVLKPSLGMLGTLPSLTDTITLTGQDVFTETALKTELRGVSVADKVLK